MEGRQIKSTTQAKWNLTTALSNIILKAETNFSFFYFYFLRLDSVGSQVKHLKCSSISMIKHVDE